MLNAVSVNINLSLVTKELKILVTIELTILSSDLFVYFGKNKYI